MNHTLFISDLHLEPERADITQCLLNFLQQQAPLADALYILGDFFEVWIGDDEALAKGRATSPFHQSIIAALRELTSCGLPIYFMHGNRDFLIGAEFMAATGCQFLVDPTCVDLYGRNTLLLHGDSLCTDDLKHQNFRKYAQNPNYNRFFLYLPLWLRRFIARRLRMASQKHTAQAPAVLMDVNQAAVVEELCRYQVIQMIHGHTHRPAIHEFRVEGQAARRIVLGDWHQQGSVLVYRQDGSCELVGLDF